MYTGLYTGLTYTIGICTRDKHTRPVNFTGQTASTDINANFNLLVKWKQIYGTGFAGLYNFLKV